MSAKIGILDELRNILTAIRRVKNIFLFPVFFWKFPMFDYFCSKNMAS